MGVGKETEKTINRKYLVTFSQHLGSADSEMLCVDYQTGDYLTQMYFRGSCLFFLFLRLPLVTLKSGPDFFHRKRQPGSERGQDVSSSPTQWIQVQALLPVWVLHVLGFQSSSLPRVCRER